MPDDTRIGASIALTGLSQWQSDVAEAETSFSQAFEKLGVSSQEASVKTDAAMTKMAESARESSSGISGSLAEINEGLESLEEAFKGLGEIFLVGAAIEAGHKIAEIAGEANETDIALLHMSERTGIAVETLNGLRGVAELADVPIQQLGRAMTQLSRQVVEAEQGSKSATAAFAAFGLSVDDLKGKNPHEVFLELADAISKTRDGMEKTGEATTLLGARVGTQLLPVMEGGRAKIEELEAAFNRLNPITHRETEEADALHRSWLAVQTAAESFAHSASDTLAPALTRINGLIAEGIVGLKAWWEAASSHGFFSLKPFSEDEVKSMFSNASKSMGAVKTLVGATPEQEGEGGNEPNITKTGGAAAARKAAEEAKALLEAQYSNFVNEQKLEVAVASETATAKTAAELKSLQAIADEAANFAEKSKGLAASLHDPGLTQKFVDDERSALAEALNLRRTYVEQLKALDSEQISTIAKEKDEQLAIIKARLDQEFDLNRIDDQQKIAGEIDLVNQQLAIDTKAVSDKMALYAADSKEYAKLVADKVSLELKAQAEIIKLQTDGAVEAANATREAWDSAFGELSTGLDDVFNTLSSKSHHMGEEWRKMWAGMAKSVIESGVNDLLLGGSKGSLGGDIFGEKGKGGGLAGLVANNADGFLAAIFGKAEADSIGERLKTITGGAGGLLGWLFGTNKATGTAGTPGTPGTGNIAGPPTPAGGVGTASSAAGVTNGLAKVADALGLHQVALALNTLQLTLQLPALIMNTAALLEDAAIKAATAIAGLFEHGGIVPSAAGGMVLGGSGSLAILHPREMVLPANISGGLQNMISRPSGGDFSRESPAANATRANQSRGDQFAGHQFHTHFSPQTPDPKAMDRFFKTNERRINASMMRSARKANLI